MKRPAGIDSEVYRQALADAMLRQDRCRIEYLIHGFLFADGTVYPKPMVLKEKSYENHS